MSLVLPALPTLRQNKAITEQARHFWVNANKSISVLPTASKGVGKELDCLMLNNSQNGHSAYHRGRDESKRKWWKAGRLAYVIRYLLYDYKK
jgi:hypothetical protein